MPKAGYLTPSTFKALMQNGKGTPFGGTAMAIVHQFALDLAGVERPEETYSGQACEWGHEHEDDARAQYELVTFSSVTLAEFRAAPDLPYVGGTADGLVGAKGGVEIKCPFSSIIHANPATNLKDNYQWQVQGYLWIYEREWWDFVSYDPRFPEEMQLKIINVERDEIAIAKLKSRCLEAHRMAVEIAEQIKTGR